MGYLKKKLRRSRAATIRRPDSLEAPGAWHPVTVEATARNVHFVRFCTSERTTRSRQHLGVFHAAGLLQRRAKMPPAALKELSATLRWFRQHLRAPSRVKEDAVFWFRSDAAECIRRVWELVWVFKDYQWEVLMMSTNQPGRVVYSDEFQVAAIRFADRLATRIPIDRK